MTPACRLLAARGSISRRSILRVRMEGCSMAIRPTPCQSDSSASPMTSPRHKLLCRIRRCPIARRRRSSSAALIPFNPCIIDNFLSLGSEVAAGGRKHFRGGFSRPASFRRERQAAMVGGPLPHDTHRMTSRRCRARRMASAIRQCRHDASPGRRAQRAMARRPLVGLRKLHIYRRSVSHDLHGAVAVQSVRQCGGVRPDYVGTPIAGIPRTP